MNNKAMEFFSIKRFGLVMARDLRENMRSLLIRYVGLLVALCVISLLIGYNYNLGNWRIDGPDPKDRALMPECGYFSFILFGLAMAYASNTMAMMSTKETRLSTLMLPASMLEKFVSAWIINVPVFVALYIGFAYFADFVRYVVFKFFVETQNAVSTFSFLAVNMPSDVIHAFFMLLIVGQSLFVLGGTIWYKRAFLKMLIVLVAIGIVYNILFWNGYTIGLGDTQLESFSRVYSEEEPSFILKAWIMTIVFSLGIYVPPDFRFKGSEIINRW